ncbi:MFS transporter [Macrococcus bovicus]|uniref:MFS transporter n=2 Tax=Macrococcus bovicus TaxID=69968 RepID=A0A4R6C318_9STAP|nr:MFS transporter [Macrococcus bovicus]
MNDCSAFHFGGAFLLEEHMNINLLLLALIAFLAGLAEFVVAGIIPYLAAYFHVTTEQAGLLVTAFAFIFAVAGPVLMMMTSAVRRRTLLISFNLLFIVGNLLSVMSTTYSMIMLSRIVLAVSVSMLVGLAFSLSVKVVRPSFQPRAISIVLMALSSAMVLGSPIGIFLSSLYSWKILFAGIAGLSVMTLYMTLKYFPSELEVEKLSFKHDMKGLFRKDLLAAHCYSFLFFTGQSVFYIYFSPYLIHEKVSATVISLLFIVFGISGTFGSGLGGLMTEKWGSRRALVILSIVYTIVMAGFLVSSSVSWLLVNTSLLGLVGWSINAPTQSYLIERSEKYASINQTVSTSSVQLGISFGALLGGMILSASASYTLLIMWAVILLTGTAGVALLLFHLSKEKSLP